MVLVMWHDNDNVVHVRYSYLLGSPLLFVLVLEEPSPLRTVFLLHLAVESHQLLTIAGVARVLQAAPDQQKRRRFFSSNSQLKHFK